MYNFVLTQVSYSRERFAHSKSANIKENMHIVTAYSDCDSNGRRAECSFMVIVRGKSNILI